jgi:RNA polymerase sigma-70 factor, ECF subfamily
MPSILPFPIAAFLGLTDEQAMGRVQSHDDEQAFTHLARRWEEPIRRLCTRMTGDEHAGQDLAQETFTRVYIHRHHYRAEARFSTWLWRIALNLCHDELRRRQRRPADASGSLDDLQDLIGSSSPDDSSAPDQAALAQEQSRLVRQALDRLPAPYRAVLILRHYENLKFREIADVLEIPEGTVKSRMTEALNRLAQLLRPSVASAAPAATARHPVPPLCTV